MNSDDLDFIFYHRLTLKGHRSPVDTLQIDDRGKTLLSFDSSGRDTSIRLWNLDNGKAHFLIVCRVGRKFLSMSMIHQSDKMNSRSGQAMDYRIYI